MSLNSPHVMDFGTIIQVQMFDDGELVNLSGIPVLQMAIFDPQGNYSVKPASLTNNGTDGLMQYIVQSGDFSLAGTYRIQAFIQNDAGSWSSSTASFKVAKNLYQP